MMYRRVSIEQLQQQQSRNVLSRTVRHGEDTRPLAPRQTGGGWGARIQFSQRLANLEVRLDWLQIPQILCQ